MSRASEDGEQRAFFIIRGLAQPLKLKLAVKSALKNLFAHVPVSHASITPEFYWRDLRLDPCCSPIDYGMIASPDHVHHIDVRIPPPQAAGPPNTSAAAVYQSMQPLALLGALTQTPTSLVNASPPKAAQPVPLQSQASGISSATARLIDELQYAVKVHSESALRLNEQLLSSQRDLAEVTDVMTKENRKLTERTLELEAQIRAKEVQRQEQVQQNISAVHQHFQAFEQEREARREEVESLQKLVKAINQEKDVFAQRNEELSRTLHQRDEEWATDLEHFTAQIKKSQHTTLQLEGRVAELSGVQAENGRIHNELTTLRPIAQREGVLLDEIARLRQQNDSLQSQLAQSQSTALSLKGQLAEEAAKHADLNVQLSNEIHDLKGKNSALEYDLYDAAQRAASRPSEAQLHAKIREVVAHNQRLTQLIKQPSTASTFLAQSPTVPPGVRASPSLDRHDVSHSHWNEAVQRAISVPAERPLTAMERMYPPAESINEPAARNERPVAPRLSQRVAVEEPRVITRDEVRRESVRVWADEALDLDDARRQSAYHVALGGSASSPNRNEDDDGAIRTVSSTRNASSVRQQTPTIASPSNNQRSQRSNTVYTMSRNPDIQNQQREMQRPSPTRVATRSRSMGDVHAVRGTSPSIGLLQNTRGSMRATDEEGRPLIPRRASVSLSRSPSSARDNFGQQEVHVASLPVRVSPVTVEESRPAEVLRMPSRASLATPNQTSSASFVSRAAVDLPQGSGGEVEAHYRPAVHVPSDERRDVIVEFEDEPIALPAVNTVTIPHRAQQSFVPTLEGPPVVIDEGPESESVVAEQASSNNNASDSTSRPQTQVTAPRRSSGFQRDERPRLAPEIDQQGLSFNRAKSAFLNSTPLAGPASPYVAPRRVQSVSDINVQRAERPIEEADPQPDLIQQQDVPTVANPPSPPLQPTPRIHSPVAGTPQNRIPTPTTVSPHHATPRDSARGGSPSPHLMHDDATIPLQDQSPALQERPPVDIKVPPRSHGDGEPTMKVPKTLPKSGLAPMFLDTPRAPRTQVPSEELSIQAQIAAASPLDEPSSLPSKTVNYEATGAAAEILGTINAAFDTACKQGALRTSMVYSGNKIAWKNYSKAATRFCKALIVDGAPLGSRVAIIGENSAEWAVSYLGTILAGCVPVSIHPRCDLNDMRTQIEQTTPRVLVVDGLRLTNQFLSEKSNLPLVDKVICMQDQIPPNVRDPGYLFSFQQFLDRARTTEVDIAQRTASITPESCAVIAFTSGATEQPKPVMYSHDNILFAAWSFACAIQIGKLTQSDGNIRLASCSPLSDVVYQVVDIILPIVVCCKLAINVVTYYMNGTESTQTQLKLLRTAKPTIFLASPATWRKLFDAADSAPEEDQKTFLGLDESGLLLWGGAPWNHGAQAQECDRRGLSIVEFYSVAEATGIVTTNTSSDHDHASCGLPLPGTSVRFVQNPQRDAASGHGELEVYGRNVAIGYFNCPTMTQGVFLDDGYLVTSDVGYQEETQHIYFVGRDTDFTINTHGEFVPLRQIEETVQLGCLAASRVVACGSNKPFIICLVALKTLRDPSTDQSTDELHPDAAAVNPTIRTVAGARTDSAFQRTVSSALQTYNQGPLCGSSNRKVHRFAFCQTEPSYENGQLTVTGKLRRFSVLEAYSGVIEKLYNQKPVKPQRN